MFTLFIFKYNNRRQSIGRVKKVAKIKDTARFRAERNQCETGQPEIWSITQPLQTGRGHIVWGRSFKQEKWTSQRVLPPPKVCFSDNEWKRAGG
jgi:hypothetical protein